MRVGILATLALSCATAAVAQSSTTADGDVPLRGVVIDASTGAAMRRARVEVSTGPGRLVAVMCDDEGRFSLDVPADMPATVRISKAGYGAATRSLFPPQLRASVPLLVALERGAAIVGQAVDTEGEAASDVGIAITGADRQRIAPLTLPMRVVPDERGEFRVGGLAPGRYVVDGFGTIDSSRVRVTPIEVHLEAGGQEVPVVLIFDRVDPATGRAPVRRFDAATGAVSQTPAAVPSTPPDGPAIRGTVWSSAGVPLSGAAVTASRSGIRRSAVTDTLGRFALAGLTPGSYAVEAFKRGYVRTEHGQRSLDLPGVKVVLDASRDVEGIAIHLPPAGLIGGIVFDEFGDPLQDASVEVVRVRRSPSGLTPVRDPALQGSVLVRTDDRGYFRAGGLMPGEYVVKASVSGQMVIDGVRAAYANAFWPAAGDLAAASPLRVRAAEEIAGLTLTLRPVRVFRLAGIVLTSAGVPASGTVSLTITGGTDSSRDRRTTQQDAKGEFAFDSVTAGEYVVQALASSGPRGPESARRTVTVDGDPERLVLRTSPGSSVTGRFVLEGAREGDVMWGYSATAAADGVAGAPASVSNLGSPLRDGEPFRLSPLAGPTRVRITSDDDNWYFKSLIIDGFDAADAIFDFGFDGREYLDAEVVFSRLGATVTGRATDERGAPVRDYAVWVFSTDRDRWASGSRWVRVARAAAGGSFRIPSLPPGHFWVVAVDRVDTAGLTTDPADAALFDALIPHAVSLVVGEAETREVTLRLLRR